MIEITTLSLFPQMFDALQHGVTARAVSTKQLSLAHWQLRDFANDKHQTVDDRPYGGGPGMVMMAEPLKKAIIAAKAASPEKSKVIYLCPTGQPLKQAKLEQLVQQPGLILLAGRYEGIDQRIVNNMVDEQLSIGDYVLTGGELAAMVVIDALSRLLPGVLGNPDSAVEDSFVSGLLDYPHYTRPETFENQNVPEVLLTGNHPAIKRWRLQQALGTTWLKRPDMLEKYSLTALEKELLTEFIEQYNRGQNNDERNH